MKYYFESEEVNTCNECNLYDVDYCRCAVDFCYYKKVLKPKELIWDKVDRMKVIAVLKLACTDVLVVHIAKTPVGNIMILETLGNKIVIDAPMLTHHLYQAKDLLDSRQNVDKAKQFCQEHYNRVFNEMLGELNENNR